MSLFLIYKFDMKNLSKYNIFENYGSSLDIKDEVTGWSIEDNSLHKKFVFRDFDEAFNFISKVAEISQKMNHHPKWTNIYKTVWIWLRTHDAGDKITNKDRELALLIDSIIQNKGK